MIPFTSIQNLLSTPPSKNKRTNKPSDSHASIETPNTESDELNLFKQEFVATPSSPTLTNETPWNHLDFCTGAPSTPEKRLFTHFEGLDTPTIHLIKDSRKQMAALKIQRVWRGQKQQRKYLHTRKSVITLQRLRRSLLKSRLLRLQDLQDSDAIQAAKHVQTQTEAVQEPMIIEEMSLEAMLEKLNHVKEQKRILEEEIARLRPIEPTRETSPEPIQKADKPFILHRLRSRSTAIAKPTQTVEPDGMERARLQAKEDALELEKLTKKNTVLNKGRKVELETLVVTMEGVRPASPSRSIKRLDDDQDDEEERDYLANVDERPSPAKRIRWARETVKRTPPKKGLLKQSEPTEWKTPELKPKVIVRRFIWPEPEIDQKSMSNGSFGVDLQLWSRKHRKNRK